MSRRSVRAGWWEKRSRYDPREVCRVCGEPRGYSHSDAKCAEQWIRKMDAEKAKAREGQNVQEPA